MDVITNIQAYIASQEVAKQRDLQTIHELMLRLHPNGQLWFLDGKNSEGKVVANPNIGYGHLLLPLAGGKTRPFYQIGLSANTTGISVYIMGLPDKTYLTKTYGHTIGKAKVTGYCITFKSLSDIHLEVLEEAIGYGLRMTGNEK